jgi:hypothetical protein
MNEGKINNGLVFYFGRLWGRNGRVAVIRI